MPNPKILIFYSRYQDVQVALYEGMLCHALLSEDKKRASSTLLLRIEDMLEQQGWTLSDIDLIATSAGPAPFTTLRVVISTVNGLGFATGKPLLGINTLELLCKEQGKNCIALLNAFCEDVYFGIYNHMTGEISMGCSSIDLFLDTLPQEPSIFVGNGTIMYKNKIQEKLGIKAIIPQHCPEEASLETLAHVAYNYCVHAEGLLGKSSPIIPLYFKAYSAKMSA